MNANTNVQGAEFLRKKEQFGTVNANMRLVNANKCRTRLNAARERKFDGKFARNISRGS